jgi:hypothetical protein
LGPITADAIANVRLAGSASAALLLLGDPPSSPHAVSSSAAARVPAINRS